MSENKSASAIRYDYARLEIVTRMATEDPDCQPEMIARHYTKLATTALQLLRACEIGRQYSSPTPNTDEVINYLVDFIKREHLNDFAIPLDWKPMRKDLGQ